MYLHKNLGAVECSDGDLFSAVKAGAVAFAEHKAKKVKQVKELAESTIDAAKDVAKNAGNYIPAPKKVEGIPGLKPAKPKTPVQGGGGLRKRWKDKKGNIYEWDSQHGAGEK